MLTKRIITAIVLGSIILIGIFYLPPVIFYLISLLIVTLAAWEFSGFFHWNYMLRINFLLLLLLIAMVSQLQPFVALLILVVGVGWWLIAPYFLWRYSLDGTNYFASGVKQLLLGILIFVPSWIGVVMIHEKLGSEFLVYLLAVICAADIGAYFLGMFWGKHLLAPGISPKKTFEGLIGGILVALLVAIIGIFLLKFGFITRGGIKFSFSMLSNVSLLMLLFVVSLWSVIGDLFESMLKRQVGIKDSGGLLPGHGGVYDRIDSLTAAIPIFALGILLI